MRGKALYYQRTGTKRPTGFTLVELLVVIGIIAVLVSMLLPTIQRARAQSQLVVCQSNLRQIGLTMRLYSHDYDDRYPDARTTGNFGYRMQPGLRTPDDRSALVETYGLAAVLHGITPQQDLSAGLPLPARYLAADNPVWICPSYPETFTRYGNTYAFSIARMLESTKTFKKKDDWLVWDNFLFSPGLSGFRGPFPGYTLKVRVYSHPGIGDTKGAAGILHFDGSVSVKSY